jgi:hypothetical protein
MIDVKGTTMSSILTVNHPEWERFVTLLERLTDECHNDLLMSSLALASMQIFDVEDSLEWLQKHGAGCDCEVLMNIEGKRQDLAILRGKMPVPDYWNAEVVRGLKRMYGIQDQ